jgi:hypothetical protein
MDMEPIQGPPQFDEVSCLDSVALHNIAEVKESRQTLDHFRRNMASDCSEVDLVISNEYGK